MTIDLSETLLRCAGRLLDAPKTSITLECLSDIAAGLSEVDQYDIFRRDDRETLISLRKHVSGAKML